MITPREVRAAACACGSGGLQRSTGDDASQESRAGGAANGAGAARSFYNKDSPIYTMSRFLPPSKVLDAEVTNSILGDGCVVRAGCTITHSVVGVRSLIGENCTVRDALLMGYAPQPRPRHRRHARPPSAACIHSCRFQLPAWSQCAPRQLPRGAPGRQVSRRTLLCEQV